MQDEKETPRPGRSLPLPRESSRFDRLFCSLNRRNEQTPHTAAIITPAANLRNSVWATPPRLPRMRENRAAAPSPCMQK